MGPICLLSQGRFKEPVCPTAHSKMKMSIDHSRFAESLCRSARLLHCRPQITKDDRSSRNWLNVVNRGQLHGFVESFAVTLQQRLVEWHLAATFRMQETDWNDDWKKDEVKPQRSGWQTKSGTFHLFILFRMKSYTQYTNKYITCKETDWLIGV